jgi:glycerol uptake facilitator-like aquaporin
MNFNLSARVVAEFLGTAFLLAAVVGSGIMAERLASGNLAIALLANTLATGAALVALILTFATISGAHFNPAVTIADALRGGIAWREAPAYIVAQIAAAFSGVGAAHIMFGLPLFSLSLHARSGGGPVVERVHRYLRIALGHLGMLSHSAHSSRLCRGSLYHCGVLVHGFDFICQSRGYTWPALPATPLPGFVLLTLPASWLRN